MTTYSPSGEHGQESLELFLQQSNLFHTTMKFTAEMSTECVTFLDTMVMLEDDILHTDLYTNSTDTHQYLSPNSLSSQTLHHLNPIQPGLQTQTNRLRHKLSRPLNPESSHHMPSTSPTTPSTATTTTPCTPGNHTPPQTHRLDENHQQTPPHPTCLQRAESTHPQLTRAGNL